MPSYTYLDYNATAPLRPEARARMLEVLGPPRNPSSVHREGRAAKKILEESRAVIAAAVSAFPGEIVFTASGTEANNWALSAFPGRRRLVSAVEHSSILSSPSSAGGGGVIPVNPSGLLRLDALEAALDADPTPALISVMLANNETGVIQPIQEISRIARAHGALLHCDAVQALGKIPVDFSLLGADLLALSAHKCGGPVGAAALVVKSGVDMASFLRGGGQEGNRRAGTENLPAIAGFAAAVGAGCDLHFMQRLAHWRDAMEAALTAEGAHIFGQGAPRLPNTSCIGMPGISQEVQLMHFDLSGIAVSAGSACSSGRIEPSHVLAAMEAGDLARSAIRVSAGWGSEEADFQRFVEAWKQLKKRR